MWHSSRRRSSTSRIPIQLDILILERCAVVGDVNGDGVLDISDILDPGGVFDCMAGPNVAVDLDCRCADGNGDGDVDLADIYMIQRQFGN